MAQAAKRASPRRQPDGRTNLTSKQEHFSQLIAEGKTQTQAYQQAYDTTGSNATASRRAHDLMMDQRIKERTEELRLMMQESYLHDVERLRLIALRAIVTIATTTNEKTSDRLRAAELLGKVRGVELFSALTQQDQRVNSPAMNELERRIRALIEPDPVQPIGIIDLTPSGHKAVAEIEKRSQPTEPDPGGRAPCDHPETS